MEKERIDDLQVNGLKLAQYEDGYCFTSDSVILANFAGAYCKGKAVVDLGTGGGIIAVLLAGKYGAESVTGVEIQEKYAELAERNAELNGLANISVICAPMQKAHEVLGYNKFEAAVCNPPYEVNGGDICRHEVNVTLAEVAESAARLIKFGGRFFMVHKAERLAEIFAALNKNKLEPKRIRFVCGTAEKKPELVLIEAHSGGKPGLIVERNLIMRERDGSETEEVNKIYGRM
jgi:tRNA1(Val) A37 N6-methylase TrmN6